MDKKELAERWNQSEKKELLLVPGIAFGNRMEVAVKDFPKGREAGETRQRLVINLDYSRSDVETLKKQGRDTLDAALEYYRDYIYRLVKVQINSDWNAVGGLEETIENVSKHIEQYY
jgi:hypothetical protein